MEIVYQKENIVKTEYDDKEKIILVTWWSLSGHPYLKECVSMHVDLVKSGAKALIIDVSNAKGVVSQEEQAWFADWVFPEYDKNGLELIITILPQSALTEMAAKKWNQTASSFSFQSFETQSIQNALELARKKLRISEL